MNKFSIVLILVILGGCSISPHDQHHSQLDRSAYYPLAVYSVDSIDQFESNAYTDDIKYGGTPKCVIGTLAYTFGLLAPLCLLTAAQDVAAMSETAGRVKDFENSTDSLLKEIEELADVALYRKQVMKYLNEKGVDATDIMLTTSTSKNIEIVELSKLGYKTAMELKLLLVNFYQDKEEFCLTTNVIAKLIGTEDRQVIAIKETTSGVCKSLNEWVAIESLENIVTELYFQASKHIINDILFMYEDLSDEDIGLTIFKPKPSPIVKLEEFEEWSKRIAACDPIDMDCGEIWRSIVPVRKKPKRYKDIELILVSQGVNPNSHLEYGLYFTEVSTTPEFKWKALDALGITDVRYDLRVYKGEIRNQSYYYQVEGTELIYSRDDIFEAQHKSEIEFQPCSWYFWTVRARFYYYGEFRMSKWSSPVGSYVYYPIRTKASKEDPQCWDRRIN